MNRRLMLALAPMVAVLSTAAVAQPPAGHAQGPSGARPPMAEMKAMHEAKMQQRMEDMKTVLRLRPNQEPALAAFMSAQGHGRKGMRGHGSAEGPKKALSTPERLDQTAKREAAMTAERAKRREALTKFYAVLDPEQRKVFDAAQRLQQRGDHRNHGGPGMKRGAPR